MHIYLGGHIPGSLNLPFGALLEEGDSTRFRSKEKIRDAFLDAGKEVFILPFFFLLFFYYLFLKPLVELRVFTLRIK